MRVGICGALGKMGREIVKTIDKELGFELVCAIDINSVGEDVGKIVLNKNMNIIITDNLKFAIDSAKPEVMIDFTQPSAIFENAKICIENGVKPVIGTTGLSDGQINELKALSEGYNVSCLIAPNFSIGAVIMMMCAEIAAGHFNNAEIIEYHHNQKKDAPSGTAIKTALMMSKINSNLAYGNYDEKEVLPGARGGNSYSNIKIHSVRMSGFVASQEVILGSPGQTLTIRHDSIDRSCYMSGILLAIKYIAQHEGFVYGLENIL